MDKVVVRRASRADRETVQAFHRSLYVEHRDAIIGPPERKLYEYRDFERVLREDVDALLSLPSRHVLLAEEEGQAVGYITGRMETDDRRLLPRRGVIEDWFVDEGARGKGIGVLLFRELVSHFRSSGCHAVESATWPANTGARAMHARLGMTEVLVTYRMEL